MTACPHVYCAQGYTCAPMVYTNGRNLARVGLTHKVYLSSDRSLQLDSLMLESLVIADQQAAVNTFPVLVHTARHTMRVDCTRSRWANPSERQAPKVWLIIRVKS